MLELSLFTTGGTIDGADSDLGSIRQISSAEQWLNNQPNVHARIHHLLNKDSRQITAEDRSSIVAAVASCRSKNILLTHGTFTIAQTGRALRAALVDTEATILLVGAWIPFGEPGSDAPTQMEFAIRSFREGCRGVFIAMDGKLWNPDKTDKLEVSPGKFELTELD